MTRYTSSAACATNWLASPARSRNRRPERLVGTTPHPTSFVTTTMGSGARRKVSQSVRICFRMTSSEALRDTKRAT